MKKPVALGAILSLGACASGGGTPPPPAPLAEDRGQPVLALFEHALTDYFASVGAGGPTVCPELRPTALAAEQEQALIVRFVRLAPAERCKPGESGPVDAITGEPAALVQVYDFGCTGAGTCRGWVQLPNVPAVRYAMRFEDDEWQFDSDRRILAE